MWSNANRDDMRQMYFICWEKYKQKNPLEPLEDQIVNVILDHPEYHTYLDQPDQYLQHDFHEESVSNPFLHMAMHLVIRDQVQTDSPQGIQTIFTNFMTKLQDSHSTEHHFVDCFGEVLWQAQRQQQAPCNQAYLDLLQASQPR